MRQMVRRRQITVPPVLLAYASRRDPEQLSRRPLHGLKILFISARIVDGLPGQDAPVSKQMGEQHELLRRKQRRRRARLEKSGGSESVALLEGIETLPPFNREKLMICRSLDRAAAPQRKQERFLHSARENLACEHRAELILRIDRNDRHIRLSDELLDRYPLSRVRALYQGV